MKRLITALLVGGALFAAAYAAAAVLDVGFGTAATGEGDVDACGDITGSTYILQGQDVTPKTGTFPTDPGDASLTDTSPTNIARTTQVNLELETSDGDCAGINLWIQLTDIGGGDLADAFGTCEVFEGGGLGFDEVGTGDNDTEIDGCTVDLAVSQDIADIYDIKVTEN
ncbi:MAG: hypothetical protein Q7R32_01070 [Dehalococcoidia bacterium]|nr:hypothetical protein [Dehalococcoidia bacterium]